MTTVSKLTFIASQAVNHPIGVSAYQHPGIVRGRQRLAPVRRVEGRVSFLTWADR